MKKLLVLVIVIYGGLTAQAQNRLASAQLEAENISKVRVEGSFCDVYVERGSRNYLNAYIEGRGDKGDYSFDTEIVGATLHVRVIRKERRSWRGYNVGKSRIELTLMEGVELDIDNSSGDIYVKDLSAATSRIEATSGDISLERVRANLEVETSSGDIRIRQLTGNLDMKSTSGDQQIYDVNGDVYTRASSGEVTISSFDGELGIATTSGDVDIREGSGRLEVRTSSGDIEGNDITLRGDANFKATSGDVEIDFTNDLSSLSFELSATSGDLEVGNKSSEKKLVINRGGYRVTGVTSSGSQEYE